MVIVVDVLRLLEGQREVQLPVVCDVSSSAEESSIPVNGSILFPKRSYYFVNIEVMMVVCRKLAS